MDKPILVTKTGVCKYCGQIKAIQVPGDYTQQMVDEEVEKKCNCPEAMEYQRIQDMIACAESQIKKFFKDRQMPLFEKMLLAAVEPMANSKMQKLSIGSGEYTISMKRKKSSIEVSIKMVTEEKVES